MSIEPFCKRLILYILSHDLILYHQHIVLTNIISLFQFNVRANDNRNPERDANSSILVRVNRNNFLPEFQGKPYEIDVTENNEVGDSVFTIVARDRDIQVGVVLHGSNASLFTYV